MPSSLPPGVASTRDERFDALRGLFLVLMAITHIPSDLSHLVHEPLGIMTSAEGFVFLAACLCGRVYGGQLRRRGFADMRTRVWGRAQKVYSAHLAILLPSAFIALQFAQQSQVLHNHFGALIESPTASLLLMPLLLHQPPLFDVLPLYVFGLLATPYLLKTGAERGWRRLLILSAMIWGLAQAGRGIRTETFLPDILAVHPGHFDLLAWQAIWITGLALGDVSARRGLDLIRSAAWRPVLYMAGAVAVAGFAIRHGLWPAAWFHTDVYLYMSKWSLGPLRVLNMAALVLLALRWNPPIPTAHLGLLAGLGRHSLSVFTAHLPMVVAITVFLDSVPADQREPGASLLGIACVLVLILFSQALERRRLHGVRALAHPARTQLA